MTLDRQPAAAAERRPRARTISMIRPIRTMAPRRIHSQMRPVLDPLAAAAGLLAGAVRVGVAALGVTDAWAVRLGDALLAGATGALWRGDGVALWLGETLEVRVGESPALALLAALPHPAAIHPATRIDA